MGLRQGPDGERLVSLLEVSKQRLPVYTVLLEAVVLVGLVVSVVHTIKLGESACFVHFAGALAEYLNTYVSGAVLMCGAAEGVIVGLAELRRKQSNQIVHQETRKETLQEAIEVLERAGNAEAAKILREQLADDRR